MLMFECTSQLLRQPWINKRRQLGGSHAIGVMSFATNMVRSPPIDHRWGEQKRVMDRMGQSLSLPYLGE